MIREEYILQSVNKSTQENNYGTNKNQKFAKKYVETNKDKKLDDVIKRLLYINNMNLSKLIKMRWNDEGITY